jgi:hypothetical protein
MNINDDYLWDRTGEPDPEVQQLEEVLGALRYQPRPLEIPAEIQIGRDRNFFRDFGPRLAIAATIAMLLLGLGVWLGLQRLRRTQPQQVAETPKAPAVNNSPFPKAAAAPTEDRALAESSPEPDGKTIPAPRQRVNQRVFARNLNRPRNQTRDSAEVALNEREGIAAKEQLMLALRLASAKLNFAQKKTQNINSRELIHNQHKIG